MNVGNLNRFAYRLNWLVERVCALLVSTMVAVIWFEVLERYFLKLGITWTEEFSRYVMIWAALLAVSCGAYYREHIGLELFKRYLPQKVARNLTIALDIISIAFFLFLFYYGLGMTAAGNSQYATIFGMTMVVPFAAVPVSSALTAIQVFAAMFRIPSGTPSGTAE
ncbi:MAG: TRAP transporter small permease [Desulfobacterales bacterium]|jgi:TRAP-type C4-dicarboxylate transport system permease small subunit